VKKLCLAALAALFLSPINAGAAPDNSLTARSEDGKAVVHLLRGKCEAPEVLVHVPPQFHSQLQRAESNFEGKDFKACWLARPDGIVIVVYEDGGVGQIPITVFVQEKGT
jgi:hypothetical protein